MISIAFVNGETEEVYSCNPMFDNNVITLVEDALHDYEDYNKQYTKFITESSISGIEDINELEVLEAEGNNVFAKIGNAIIGVLKKFTEAISKLIDRFKNIGFRNKSEMDKVEALIKKHPDLKEKIVAHANDFDFRDIDSLSKMEDQFKQIMKTTDSNIAKKILSGMGKAADTTVKAAAGVGTVVGLGTAIQKLKNGHTSTEKRLKSSLDNAREAEQKIVVELDRLAKANDASAGLNDAIALGHCRLAAARKLTNEAYGKYRGYIQTQDNIWGKIKKMVGLTGSTGENDPRNSGIADGINN